MTLNEYREKILKEIIVVESPIATIPVIEKAQRVLDSANITSEAKSRFWVKLYADLEEIYKSLDIGSDDVLHEEIREDVEIATESQSADALSAIIRSAKSAVAKKARL